MNDQFEQISLEERIELLTSGDMMTSITTEEEMIAYVNSAISLLREALVELQRK